MGISSLLHSEAYGINGGRRINGSCFAFILGAKHGQRLKFDRIGRTCFSVHQLVDSRQDRPMLVGGLNRQFRNVQEDGNNSHTVVASISSYSECSRNWNIGLRPRWSIILMTALTASGLSATTSALREVRVVPAIRRPAYRPYGRNEGSRGGSGKIGLFLPERWWQGIPLPRRRR